MKRKTLGIIILIIGLIFVGGSLYIGGQVTQGKESVRSAQKNVDQGSSFFSLVPEGKEVGGTLSHPFQQKIDEGKGEIQKYERISHWLMVFGIIGVIIGIVSLVTCRKKQ